MLSQPEAQAYREVATHGVSTAGDLFGAIASREQPAVRLLDVILLGWIFVLRRAPEIDNKRSDSGRLGDMPRNLPVAVHGENNGSTCVAMKQNAVLIASVWNAPKSRHAARIDFAKEQIESVLAIPADDALPISAKSGLGVEDVLEAIVRLVPPPKGSADSPLRALIFDSWFDIYRGAVVLVRVVEGRLTPGTKICLCAGNEVYEVEALGALTPKPVVRRDVGALVAQYPGQHLFGDAGLDAWSWAVWGSGS